MIKPEVFIVKLSCETDFVAKGEDFIGFATKAAELALANFPATLEDLLKIDMDGLSVGERVTELVGKINEKIELASYERLEAAMISPYIHAGNKASVLVGLSKADDGFFDAGRDVAMQVAAMRPVAVDKDGVDEATVAKEIEIGKEQARQEGKPDHILERIAQGKLQKFFKDNTLLNQQFVKDSKKSVRDYLQSFDKELTVTSFKHVTLGIKKRRRINFNSPFFCPIFHIIIPNNAMKYKRILLKLSGESLMGEQGFGIDPKMLRHYANQIKELTSMGVQVAVVIGGGNIFRGLQASESGIERVQGDYMGMMATVINGMALQSALEGIGVFTRLISAIEMKQIAEPYIRRRAIRHLEKGRVVIFSSGTGSPYFHN